MAAANRILTPDRGKAHSVALGVLCALTVVQVSAMVRGVWLAKSKQVPPAVSQTEGGVTLSPGAPSAPAVVPAAPVLIPPPPVPSSSPSASATPVGITPLQSKTTAPHIGTTTSDDVQELIDLAQQLRPLGDLQGALDVLRRADTTAPDNPAVLVEIAQTYDQMGLKDKAQASWKKVQAMGARAGEAYAIASRRLGGSAAAPQAPGASLSPSTGLTTPDPRPGDPSKMLGIGECELIRDRSVTRGEKVTLRLPIRSRPGEVIDPAVIDIDVFFFDLVNGEKVEQTKADVPVNTWVDAPVDWKDGQERLDLVYSMPEMTADVVRSIGQRQFHGYIVKLYYRHKLQDTVMAPASLQNFGAGGAPQTTGNPLLPPVAR